jgi:hypothetical protein
MGRPEDGGSRPLSMRAIVEPLTFVFGRGFQNDTEDKPMVDLYQILAAHHVEYERYDHPAVYTVEDVRRLVPPLPAVKTKNLFLRDHNR